MGCDIHNRFEVQGDDGVWRAIYVDSAKMDEDETERLQWHTADAEEEGREPPKNLPLEWWGRNYSTFAILANVRNGYGFAGVQTGEGFEPIAAGRGIPDDASPESKEMSEGWGVDGHSHTWVSLAELLDTEWQKKVTVQYGVMDADQYVAWRRANEGRENPEPPEAYCGDVWGGKIKKITDTEADKMLAEDGKLDPTVTHVRTHWAITYGDCAKWFMEFIYSRVVTLGHDPTRVRMVMLFDN